MSRFPAIEVHGHFVPPVYKQALVETGMSERDRFPVPKWDADLHVQYMDAMNIRAAVVSLSSPDIHYDDPTQTLGLCRAINESGAQLTRDNPARFGYFAALPLPDVDAALSEVEYAYEALKVDGIRLSTNTKGLYLGDPKLDPLFERLNHHNAIIYLHPTMPAAVPANVLVGYPVPMMEFIFDTARAVTNMVLNGVLDRYPNIKIIVPHAGGVLPILVPRIHGILKVIRKPEQVPDIPAAFRRLYYDSAGPSILQQLRPLLNVTDDTHVLYGTDWPWCSRDECAQFKDMIENTGEMTDQQKRKLFLDNALDLFPRFK